MDDATRRSLMAVVAEVVESEWRPWCDEHDEPLLNTDSPFPVSFPKCWRFNWSLEHGPHLERCVPGGRLIVNESTGRDALKIQEGL